MRGRWAAAAVLLVACASKKDAAAPPSPPRDAGRAEASTPVTDSGATSDTGPAWTPGTMLPSLHAGPRAFLDLRGLIHEHSIHSHDACDNAPRDAGLYDQNCLGDFRAGLCAAAHDYVMLTDHPSFFADVEYPDTLLYSADSGDRLVERAGDPVANHAACPDGTSTLLLAGAEGSNPNFMPVGLERHVGADPAARRDAYGANTKEATDAFRAAGAVTIAEHTENYTAAELATMPIDGFEMYNLHANLLLDVTRAAAVLAVLGNPDQLMQPDLVMLQVFTEDPRYVDAWGAALAQGARRVTTMGTDAHRNSLPMLLPDGDRVDSYRRMNKWFSNHLLVRPDDGGAWDDRSLKDALRSGRLYGVFEVMGYAAGFDYRAEVGRAVHEMGEDVSLADSPGLVAVMPHLRRLDPGAEAPELTVRILHATLVGWEEVASGSSDVRFSPVTPGAYRAEVRMRPRHLAAFLHSFAALATADFPWIYSNPIYVVP